LVEGSIGDRTRTLRFVPDARMTGPSGLASSASATSSTGRDDAIELNTKVSALPGFVPMKPHFFVFVLESFSHSYPSCERTTAWNGFRVLGLRV
jgi:hypothetical protein